MKNAMAAAASLFLSCAAVAAATSSAALMADGSAAAAAFAPLVFPTRSKARHNNHDMHPFSGSMSLLLHAVSRKDRYSRTIFSRGNNNNNESDGQRNNEKNDDEPYPFDKQQDYEQRRGGGWQDNITGQNNIMSGQRDYRQNKYNREPQWPQQYTSGNRQERGSQPLPPSTQNYGSETRQYYDDYNENDDRRNSFYSQDSSWQETFRQGSSSEDFRRSDFRRGSKQQQPQRGRDLSSYSGYGGSQTRSFQPQLPQQRQPLSEGGRAYNINQRRGQGGPTSYDVQRGALNGSNQLPRREDNNDSYYNLARQAFSDGQGMDNRSTDRGGRQRETAFNRSRGTTSFGDRAPSPMSSASNRYDTPQPPLPPPPLQSQPSTRRTNPVAPYYQSPTTNNMNDNFRTRGEPQYQQYGREVAFDRSSYEERQRQNFESKSTTLGQKKSSVSQGLRSDGGLGGRVAGRPLLPPRQQQQQQFESNRASLQQYGDRSQWPDLQKQQQRQRQATNNGPLGFGFRTVQNMLNGMSNKVEDIVNQIIPEDTNNTSSEEEKITKVMLADARYYLNTDPEVTDIFDGDITVGEAYSRSYSSTMVNGKTLYRVQITFPINGSSRGGGVSGQGTLIGTQDGITKMEVDVRGRVINVRV